MRRILVPLVAVLAAYCAYLTTVPAPDILPDEPEKMVTARITREIDLPARSFYAACLGRYGDETQARVEAARLAKRGAAGCLREDDGEFAVVGAVYESQGEAISVCRRLEANEDIGAEVLLCASDAVRIRITAGEDQIFAMEGALQAIEEICPELSALSYGLDGGDMTADTARTLLGVLKTRAAEADDGLKLAAGNTQDRFCLMLMEITGEMRSSLEFLTEDISAGNMELSSALKSTSISAMLGISDMMDNLR